MEITPEIIRGKEFSTSFRGYNCREIDKFLEYLAGAYEKLWEENRRLSREVKDLQERLNKYHSRKEELEVALITVQRSARLIDESSRERAKLIIEEAESRARKIKEKEEEKLEKLREELFKLNQQKKLFLTKIKSLLQAHAELLNFYEEDIIPTELLLNKKKTGAKKNPPPASDLDGKEEEIVLDE